MTEKNKGGRPSVDPYLKRSLYARLSPAERDALEEMGYTLSEGTRLAVAEFIARGKRNAKQ